MRRKVDCIRGRCHVCNRDFIIEYTKKPNKPKKISFRKGTVTDCKNCILIAKRWKIKVKAKRNKKK